jgi:hypothetical protein
MGPALPGAVLGLGLVIDICYRDLLSQGLVNAGTTLVRTNKDLWGLVFLSFVVAAVYQARHRALRVGVDPSQRWAMVRPLVLAPLVVLLLQALTRLLR